CLRGTRASSPPGTVLSSRRVGPGTPRQALLARGSRLPDPPEGQAPQIGAIPEPPEGGAPQIGGIPDPPEGVPPQIGAIPDPPEGVPPQIGAIPAPPEGQCCAGAAVGSVLQHPLHAAADAASLVAE